MASAIAVYLFVCSCCFDAMTYRCIKNVDKDLMNIEYTFLKCSDCYKKCCLLGYCARPHERKKKLLDTFLMLYKTPCQQLAIHSKIVCFLEHYGSVHPSVFD